MNTHPHVVLYTFACMFSVDLFWFWVMCRLPHGFPRDPPGSRGKWNPQNFESSPGIFRDSPGNDQKCQSQVIYKGLGTLRGFRGFRGLIHRHTHTQGQAGSRSPSLAKTHIRNHPPGSRGIPREMKPSKFQNHPPGSSGILREMTKSAKAR